MSGAVLRVEVGDRARALALSAVRAVVPAPSVTEFPGAAPTLRGLFAWRDRVVPLVAIEPRRRGAVAVIVESEGSLIALEVDAVRALSLDEVGDPTLDLDAVRALVALRAGAAAPA